MNLQPPSRQHPAGVAPPIDFQRLTTLCAQPPVAEERIAETHTLLWRAASEQGDLMVSERHAPEPMLYIPPSDRHVIVVALADVPRRITWTATEGARASEVRTGDVLILPAGEAMFLHLAVPHRAVVMSLRPRALYRRRAQTGALAQARPLLRGGCELRDPVIRQLAITISAAVQQRQPDCGSFLDAMADALSIHLRSNHAARPGAAAQDAFQDRLARVVAYLEAHMDQKVDLQSAASVAGYSTYHFSHLFKEATGQPPMRYLLGLKMQRARELIEGSKLSIADVGTRVGYDNLAHFSRTYRAFWQEPPSATRRKH